MSLPFLQVLYISAARAPFAEDELMALVHEARRDNAKRGITGLLLYSDGHFIQLLEGEPEVVRELSAKIKSDTRHHEFQVILHRPAEERLFPDWAMGVASNVELSDEHRAEFSTFIDDVRSGRLPASPDDRAPIRLLRRFAEVVGR